MGHLFRRGLPVVVADTVAEVGYSKGYTISDFPVEQGAFASFDSVEQPFEGRVRLATGGSAAARQVLIDSVETVLGDLNTYDLVTPDRIYINANVTREEYKRSTPSLLEIDVGVQEIRILASSTTGQNTADPRVGRPGERRHCHGDPGQPSPDSRPWRHAHHHAFASDARRRRERPAGDAAVRRHRERVTMADSDDLAGQAGLTSGNSAANLHDLRSDDKADKRRGLMPVRIVAVYGGGPSGMATADVMPLVHQADGLLRPTPHGTIYGVSVGRQHSGSGGLVSDPVVGDVYALIPADRDMSKVKASGGQASRARHEAPQFPRRWRAQSRPDLGLDPARDFSANPAAGCGSTTRVGPSPRPLRTA